MLLQISQPYEHNYGQIGDKKSYQFDSTSVPPEESISMDYQVPTCSKSLIEANSKENDCSESIYSSSSSDRGNYADYDLDELEEMLSEGKKLSIHKYFKRDEILYALSFCRFV